MALEEVAVPSGGEGDGCGLGLPALTQVVSGLVCVTIRHAVVCHTCDILWSFQSPSDIASPWDLRHSGFR